MDLSTGPIHDRFQHLLRVISSDRFLKMYGIGNEVPFFICPYKPEEEIEMQRMHRQLSEQLDQQGINVLNINLYDLSVEILKSRGIWEQIVEEEKNLSKAELLETLTGVLDCKHNLVPAIANEIDKTKPDVLFVSGIGEVYPYIRTHSLLENMQPVAKEFPSVYFFPGTYSHSIETGAYLDLFNKFLTDKYYRAFNIYFYET